MTLREFTSQSDHPSELVRAVAEQVGGWIDFTEVAEDISNHGADAGFSGFTYYSETVEFAEENLDHIIEALDNFRDSVGESSIAKVIQNFNCVHNDILEDEINNIIYKKKETTNYQQIMNALAWFSIEEIAREYVDFAE